MSEAGAIDMNNETEIEAVRHEALPADPSQRCSVSASEDSASTAMRRRAARSQLIELLAERLVREWLAEQKGGAP